MNNFEKLQATFFDIQKFSISDGPGIRTLVFFKGCPLRCEWCANPEGQKFKHELFFFEDRCKFCGKCEVACPHGNHSIIKEFISNNRENEYPGSFKLIHNINRNGCLGEGECVKACPNDALRLVGFERRRFCSG